MAEDRRFVGNKLLNNTIKVPSDAPTAPGKGKAHTAIWAMDCKPTILQKKVHLIQRPYIQRM